MAFTKQIVITEICVTDHGTIVVKRSIIISEDGVELGRVPKTNEYKQGDNIDAEPAKVRSICAIVWS
jgi:hypothetical protein